MRVPIKEVRIKQYVISNYLLDVKKVERIKNSYKILTKDKEYCLKVVEYEFSHFIFIISAIKHLQKNGFKNIPQFICNKNGKQYGKIDNYFIYLTEWIPSRVSNYNNPIELERVSAKLGELHECSKNFIVNRKMKPRIYWFSWIKTFETRLEEILDFKKRIGQKFYKSDFDKIYLENIDKEITKGNNVIESLKRNNYFDVMQKEVFKGGFCHHDYANHNILVDTEGGLNVIDFDYCILDSHIHDLASLLIRNMKNNRWNEKKADKIIDSYSRCSEVNLYEIPIMREFMKFPQSFWQLGLQAYWEQQPWGNETFNIRLKRYIEDEKERSEFLDDYFRGGN